MNVVVALASIRMDDTRRREDSEEASIFLAQICPITTKKGGRNPNAKIGAAGAKLSRGVSYTGVEIRYYKRAEFMVLKPEQKSEVFEYKATKDGGKWKGKGKGKGKPFDKERSRNDGCSPSEKKIESTISADFADQTNDTSKTTAIVKILKTLVASFTCKNPGNDTIGSAAAEEEVFQHKNAMMTAGSLQSIMRGTKRVKFVCCHTGGSLHGTPLFSNPHLITQFCVRRIDEVNSA